MWNFALYTAIFYSLQFVTCRGETMTPLENATVELSYEFREILNMSLETNCQIQVFERGNFEILSAHELYLPMYNKTFPSTIYRIGDDKLFICLNRSEEEVLIAEKGNSTFNEHSDCVELIYEPHEYELLQNGSVFLMDAILPENTYEFYGEMLIVCDPLADYYYHEHKSTTNRSVPLPEALSDTALIYVGNTAASISVVSLMIYLLIFSIIPDLRNLPGWNLTSMNIAFLLAYLTLLVGQISEIVGTACSVFAIFQQYFFLSAFFWMNVLSFDIWRALRNATKKLTVSLNKMKKIRFFLYSVYGWGMPLVSTTAAIVVDNSEDAPGHLRPGFGMDDFCWFKSNDAKAVFFGIPGTIIFVINFILFLLSCYMIIHNTMENSNSSNVVKRNFILYARLSVMMGILWLFGVIAVVSSKNLWIVFNLLLNLQGLFVLLLFAFTRKVWRFFRKSIIPGSQTSSFREQPMTSMSGARKIST